MKLVGIEDNYPHRFFCMDFVSSAFSVFTKT
jgi:hypothetical protein